MEIQQALNLPVQEVAEGQIEYACSWTSSPSASRLSFLQQIVPVPVASFIFFLLLTESRFRHRVLPELAPKDLLELFVLDSNSQSVPKQTHVLWCYNTKAGLERKEVPSVCCSKFIAENFTGIFFCPGPILIFRLRLTIWTFS
jgi:hypothetical protein